MPHQNHTISRHWELPASLSLKNRPEVCQSLPERLGAIEGLSSLQKSLHCSRITAWMIHKNQWPAGSRQSPGQPVKMLWISSQTRQENDPELIAPVSVRPPDLHLQRFGTMGYGQADESW